LLYDLGVDVWGTKGLYLSHKEVSYSLKCL
jgi:hypothetical protein